jgi:coenzyme F420-reducing hydrogenase beta subunit
MKIAAVVMVYNEELLLPLFLNHYNYLDEIHVLYETDSNDGTLDILKQASNAIVRPCHIEAGLDDIDKAQYLTDALCSIKADWAYILDCDEFIFPPGETPQWFLTRQDEKGYNLVRAAMFQVYRHRSDTGIDSSAPPILQRVHGDPDVTSRVAGPHRDSNWQYIKPIVVKPAEGLVINPGHHSLAGDTRVSPELYYGAHWAMADPFIAVARRMSNKERISARNKERHMGWQHWEVTREWITAECNRQLDAPVIEELSTDGADELMRTRLMLKVALVDCDVKVENYQRQVENYQRQVENYQRQVENYQRQVEALENSTPMRLARAYQSRVNRVLPPSGRRRGVYNLLLAALRVLLQEGWRALAKQGWQKVAGTATRDLGPVASVYLSHSADDTVRQMASSGGFVKGFLSYLLDAKVVDYAIVTRTGGECSPLKPETIITNSKADILSSRTNSVYMAHDALEPLGRLDNGKRYVFVGLPCQVRRLREMQREKGVLVTPGGVRGHLLYQQVEVVVSLLCNYAPTPALTQGILSRLGVRECDLVRIEYRGNGWPGGFTAYLRDGSTRFLATRDYWRNDLNNAPPMCRRCTEIGVSADITVGDPWNLSLEKRDTKGQTLVICRTQKADTMVKAAAQYIQSTPCSVADLVRSQGGHVREKQGRRDEPAESALRIASKASRYPVLRQLLRLAYRNRPIVWYWREEKREVNYGDYITEVLLRGFGHKPVAYSLAKDLGLRLDSCLLVIGSELHRQMIDHLRVSTVHVWGQGKGHGDPFDMQQEPYCSKVRIHAVRGPHTLKQLNLDEDMPMGDPGLLLPLVMRIKKDPGQHKVSYIPHWSNRYSAREKLPEIGAERVVDVMCQRRGFKAKVTEVVSSSFVLTNSLHTAIVCEAYGTPWALCLPAGHELNFPDKWRDWFEYLGVADYAAQGYKDGLEWWQRNRSKATVHTEPLLNAFPLSIVGGIARRKRGVRE